MRSAMNSISAHGEENIALLQVEGLTHAYDNGTGSIVVLKGVSLGIRTGEMVAIMGPSGSGKSTLLSILGLLMIPTAGNYTVLGRNVLQFDRSSQASFRRTYVGFVFQKCNLVDTCSVYENLEFPLIYAGVKRSERPEKIQDALVRVNMAHRLHHRANQLSGGEQQRVAIARALVNSPLIVLADEPTGQLDRMHGELVMDHFEQILSDKDKAVLIVTHDPHVASRCTRVCLLEDGVLKSN
jgi:putative ABC transport system ATP-binding protein